MKWVEVNNVLVNMELVESIELDLNENAIVLFTRHDYFPLNCSTSEEAKEKFEKLKELLLKNEKNIRYKDIKLEKMLKR